ncbi:hypothetical protein [Stieleria varia]|uniref:Uncharacterized protein n=1 Tax=Stieleria varia TaxID=2528005 RepID=A0A5C6A089_9BACT|nr:hypothetical protein [Stieleria varia]TWT92727.1 hypothetical protein Pla52n_60920 [Stieleria varia]
MFIHCFFDRPPAVLRSTLTAAVCCLLLLYSSGCSKDDLKEIGQGIVDEGKKLATSATEAVEAQLPATGSIELTTTPALTWETANIELISIGDGRPSMLQIASYDTTKDPSGQSILIHAPTTATSLSTLVDQPLPCSVFLRAQASGPVACTTPGQPILVTLGAINADDNTVSVQIDRGSLMGSDGKTIAIGGGKAIAVVKGDQ